jgi:hypothetical protein
MARDRESATTDALLTDLYLDALLAGAVLDAASGGLSGNTPGRLDPAARRAADRLRHDLVRVHPSFRFEERLATRLAEAAVAMRVPVAAGDERIVAFRSAGSDEHDAGLIPDAAQPSPGTERETGHEPGEQGDPARRVPTRPLLIGGALTSAALSIAGAAYVAWRLGRPGRASTPMARAARAVREAHLAASIASAATSGGARVVGDSLRAGTRRSTGRRRLAPRRLD